MPGSDLLHASALPSVKCYTDSDPALQRKIRLKVQLNPKRYRSGASGSSSPLLCVASLAIPGIQTPANCPEDTATEV